MRSGQSIQVKEDNGESLGHRREIAAGLWEIAIGVETFGLFRSTKEADEALRTANQFRTKGMKAYRDGISECPHEAGKLEATDWWHGHATEKNLPKGPATIGMGFD